jgi:diguanylate cyclase (GGDEF)-like protein
MKKMEAELHVRVVNRTDALERAIGSLKHQASRDALTGLYNRRALDELLPKLIEQCRTGGQDLSVMMIDVDHFKPLNDTLGHAAGDAVLKAVAQIIRSSINGEDQAGFRNGGDEFVVVLPNITRTAAQAIADRMAKLVTALTKPLKVSRKPALSIGVCAMSELEDPTIGKLLAEADKRLYTVKQQHHAMRKAS